eukprot:5708000-Prymnesium_polylepis.1
MRWVTDADATEATAEAPAALVVPPAAKAFKLNLWGFLPFGGDALQGQKQEDERGMCMCFGERKGKGQPDIQTEKMPGGQASRLRRARAIGGLSLIHISEPTRRS